jgi:mRNA interferase MazF
MPAEAVRLVLRAGQIVLADWRGDALPKEPNKRRPAVVVEDDALFAPSYPNAILVPLTEDAALAIPDLSVAIAPTADNGCSKPCWAVSHLVATTSKARLQATPSRIRPEQLVAIRRQIALAIGIEE